MTPEPTVRWWEYARKGAIYCHAHPFGHHFRNTFHVNESGFINCERQVPAIDPDFAKLAMLNDKGMFREANQWRVVLETRGVVVPTGPELEAMVRGARKVPCGRWVFLYAIRGGGIVTAEVSLDEKAEMEHLSTPTEMIDYLGIMRKAG